MSKPLFILSIPILLSLGKVWHGPIPTSETNASCTLQLVGIECIRPEGQMTLDAIYFRIGDMEWPKQRLQMGSSIPNNYIDLEGYADIQFSGSITVELWDDDTWDPDDFLGTKTIACSYDNAGVARFTEDGVDYKLYYRVK